MGSFAAVASLRNPSAPLRYKVHVSAEDDDKILLLIYPCRFDFIGPVFQKLPEYLSATGYQCPTAHNGPLQYAWNTKLCGFDYVMEPQHANTLQDLNIFMKGRREGSASWLDFYPFAERILAGSESREDSVTVVDVGGGLGHVLLEIHERFPEIRGGLILQDLPKTIQQAEVEAEKRNKFELMAHDFFSPQPVKGMSCLYFIPRDTTFR